MNQGGGQMLIDNGVDPTTVRNRILVILKAEGWVIPPGWEPEGELIPKTRSPFDFG